LLLGIHYQNSPEDMKFHRTSSAAPALRKESIVRVAGTEGGGEAQAQAEAEAETEINAKNVFVMDQGGILARDSSGSKKDEIYFMGIIDVLQQYNNKKAAENFFKGFKHDRKEISAVNPKWYAERFVNFMKKHSS
jgi:hypothetical protein